MGINDAEIIRNIILAWLAEKSMISSIIKKRLKLNPKSREG